MSGAPAVSVVDYHTGGEPFRIVTGGVAAARGDDDPGAPALRARPPRPLPPAARARAARARGHVRLPRRPAERRRRRPRRRLLPQRGLLDRMRARDDRARDMGARRGRRPVPRGREPRRRGRSLGPARDVGHGRSGPRTVGAIPQRAVVRLGEGVEAAGRVVDVAFGGAFYASLEERVEPRELPRLIELGRAIKRGDRGRAGRRPSARAGAPRHLRGHLLAGRARRAAHAAERHRLRRRRGRPLALRQRDLGPARAARRAGPPPARRGPSPPLIVGTEFTRPRRGRRRGRGAPGRGHRGRGQRLPNGRARVRARSGRSARRGLPPALTYGTSIRTSLRTVSAVKPAITIAAATSAAPAESGFSIVASRAPSSPWITASV